MIIWMMISLLPELPHGLGTFCWTLLSCPGSGWSGWWCLSGCCVVAVDDVDLDYGGIQRVHLVVFQHWTSLLSPLIILISMLSIFYNFFIDNRCWCWFCCILMLMLMLAVLTIFSNVHQLQVWEQARNSCMAISAELARSFPSSSLLLWWWWWLHPH